MFKFYCSLDQRSIHSVGERASTSHSTSILFCKFSNFVIAFLDLGRDRIACDGVMSSESGSTSMKNQYGCP